MKLKVIIKIYNEIIFEADLLKLGKELIIKNVKIDKDDIKDFIIEKYSVGKFYVEETEIVKEPYEDLIELLEDVQTIFPNLTYEKTK